MLVTTQKFNKVINLNETTLIELLIRPSGNKFQVSANLIDGSMRVLGVYKSNSKANRVLDALSDSYDDGLHFYSMPQDSKVEDDAADKSE